MSASKVVIWSVRMSVRLSARPSAYNRVKITYQMVWNFLCIFVAEFLSFLVISIFFKVRISSNIPTVKSFYYTTANGKHCLKCFIMMLQSFKGNETDMNLRNALKYTTCTICGAKNISFLFTSPHKRISLHKAIVWNTILSIF